LEEWLPLSVHGVNPPAFGYHVKYWEGVHDLSFSLSVVESQKFLVLGIRVKDEYLLKEESVPHRADGILIDIDARPESDRDFLEKVTENGALIKIFLNPFEDLPGDFDEKSFNLKGLKTAYARNDSGYTAEISIPMEALDVIQKKPWKSFRMNILLFDYDDPKDFTYGKLKELHWWPNWRKNPSLKKVGTFYREESQNGPMR